MEDMRLEKKNDKNICLPCDVDEQPSYPYGLRINLDAESIKKLGIDLPNIKEKLELNAIVEVVGVHLNDEEEGLSLQIVAMELNSKEKKNKSDILYGA